MRHIRTHGLLPNVVDLDVQMPLQHLQRKFFFGYPAPARTRIRLVQEDHWLLRQSALCLILDVHTGAARPCRLSRVRWPWRQQPELHLVLLAHIAVLLVGSLHVDSPRRVFPAASKMLCSARGSARCDCSARSLRRRAKNQS